MKNVLKILNIDFHAYQLQKTNRLKQDENKIIKMHELKENSQFIIKTCNICKFLEIFGIKIFMET